MNDFDCEIINLVALKRAAIYSKHVWAIQGIEIVFQYLFRLSVSRS